MRMKILFLSLLLVLVASFAFAGDLVGTWEYSLNGQQVTVDLKNDGTFTSTRAKVTVRGTYRVMQNKLMLVSDNQTTTYDLISYTGKMLTMKKERDTRVIICVKK